MRERKRRLWVRREQGESGRKLDRAQTFPKIRQSELRDNVALELWNCNDNIFQKKNVHIFVITQSKLRKNPKNVGDGVNSSKPKCNKISVWKWGDYKSKCWWWSARRWKWTMEEEKVNKKDYKRRWRMLSSDSMAWLGGCLWRKEASVALSNLSNCQLPISQFAWKLQEAVERLRWM